MCMSIPALTTSLSLSLSPVVDDTDHDRITAGSLVTLSITLYRTSLIEHCGISLEELQAELSAEQGKETTPPPDRRMSDIDIEV